MDSSVYLRCLCLLIPLSVEAARFSLVHSSLDGGGGPAAAGRFDSDSALVSLAGSGHIYSLRDAPVAGRDFLTFPPAGVFSTAVSNLLANDFDFESDPRTFSILRTNTTHGGMVSISNGILTYTPPPTPDPRGDSFFYVVSDGFGVGTIGKVILISPDAAPQLLGLQRTETNIVAQFQGLPETAYFLQFRPGFEPNTAWTDYPASAAIVQRSDTNGVFQFSIPVALGHGFFRAVDLESLRRELIAERDGGQFAITGRGIPNELYKLQFRANLNSPDAWRDFPDNTAPFTVRAGSDGLFRISMPITSQNGFFRTVPR
jgi:hypothetical protein